jgi:hypothetical protein
MKKLIFILLSVFLTTGIFTSCEEEEEPIQALTEFIVGGNWVYTQIEYNVTHVLELTFTGAFYADGTYALLLSDGTNTEEFDGNYSIDDKLNQLTIDEPDIENEGEVAQTVFVVEWQEGVEQMTWLPVDPLEDDDPMLWVRNYNE